MGLLSAIMVHVILICLAVIALWRPLIKKPKKWPFAGSIAIIMAYGLFGTYDVVNRYFGPTGDKEETIKEVERGTKEVLRQGSSTREKDSAEHSGILNKLDSPTITILKKDEKPTLNIYPDLGPFATVKKIGDKYFFYYTFMNYTDPLAYNLKSYLGLLYNKRSSPFYNEVPSNIINESMIAHKGLWLRIEAGLKAKVLPDSAYFYVRIRYQNGRGQEQQPLRGIFLFTPDLIDKQLTIVVDSIYKKVKSDLTGRGVW